LSPKEQKNFRDLWGDDPNAEPPVETRTGLMEDAGFDAATAKKFAGTPFSQLPRDRIEALWEGRVRTWLETEVGPDAAARVFPEAATTRRASFDRSDHGILSQVVREKAASSLWTPIPALARWNPWMWSTPGSVPPTYLTGLFLVAVVFGLLWVVFVVLNRE